jgi:acetyl-CoA C-acetyltransferase
MPEDVLLAGAVRSPQGRHGGTLRDVPMLDLAVPVAREALARAGVAPDAVDEVILSCRHQAGNGPNPGRTLAVQAGCPQDVTAHTVNMACASGLKAVALAAQAVRLGDADVVLVVGADSMSTIPYYGPSSLRWGGLRHRDVTFVDGWKDGLDPLSGVGMGITAETLADRFDVPRDAQDAWALASHQRAIAARDAGRFDVEVLPVDLDGARLDTDETIRDDTTADRLASLRPVFTANGVVTAGNASQMGDAAAAVVVLSPAAAARHGVTPQGRFVHYLAVGVDPEVMGIGPAVAIPRLLDRAGLATADIDRWEINEAFAAQIVHNVRELGLDPDRVNVNGGAIALAHPTGQTGTRLVVTLLHELAHADLRRGVVSLCVGGGQGVAALVERP